MQFSLKRIMLATAIWALAALVFSPVLRLNQHLVVNVVCTWGAGTLVGAGVGLLVSREEPLRGAAWGVLGGWVILFGVAAVGSWLSF